MRWNFQIFNGMHALKEVDLRVPPIRMQDFPLLQPDMLYQCPGPSHQIATGCQRCWVAEGVGNTNKFTCTFGIGGGWKAGI